jgi:hypothetical protein
MQPLLEGILSELRSRRMEKQSPGCRRRPPQQLGNDAGRWELDRPALYFEHRVCGTMTRLSEMWPWRPLAVYGPTRPTRSCRNAIAV